MLTIHLPAYRRGIHDIAESPNPEQLDLDPALFGDIEVRIRLDRHDPYLQVNFRLSAAVNLECDRCLTGFAFDLNVEGPMIYVLGSPSRGEDIDDPNLVVVRSSTVDLDITQEVRDLLLLGLPGKCLCREDCRGLCAQCGTDLNLQTCSCNELAA